MNKSGNRWTKETILAAINDYAQRHEKLPTMELWKTSKGTGGGRYPSSPTVSKHFGSWAQAMDEYRALSSEGDLHNRPYRKPWTPEEVIASFHKWYEIHHVPPTTRDASAPTGNFGRILPSPAVVKRFFGSWNAAIAAAGFIPLLRGATRKSVQKYMPLPRNR